MPNDSETDVARSGSVQPDGSAMSDAEAEQVAWEWFAGAHPHEAHAEWPDRFWSFFQSRCPGITREQMNRTLMETDELPNDQAETKTVQKTEGGGTAASSALLVDGWREYPNQFKKYARCFYKRFDTPTRCHGNNDNPGMQIQISVSEYEGRASMELELCAGLKDETWLTIHNYALPKTVKEATALIPRMLAAWESANDQAHL